MKILFLPNNIASIASITAAALNKIPDTEAKCLIQSVNKYTSEDDSVIFLPANASKRNPLKWLKHKLFYDASIKKLIRWADILHYTWGHAFGDARDLEWAKKFNKPIFIEWLGSDIRIPEYLFNINPYYKHAFFNGYEYRNFEEGDYKQKVQNAFSKAGATPLVCPEMSLFLDKKLFSKYVSIFQRINVQEFEPVYPSIQNKKPLIVHSPTVKIGKGSNIIIAVIEELKNKFDFEFKLLSNMKREEVLSVMKEADIFIDQIICGSYGMASCEAMAFGKPVICYIMPEVFEAGLPSECPIINTNPDNLKTRLTEFILDAGLRNEAGRKSRAFVEKYHDADKIALELIALYKQSINIKQNFLTQ